MPSLGFPRIANYNYDSAAATATTNQENQETQDTENEEQQAGAN